jgi:hypothetical protein
MTTSYTVFQAQSTPASPGLNVPTPGQPLAGIPPNMSVMAAISAGLLPINALQTALGTRDSRPGRSVSESISEGFTNGMGLTTTNPFGWPCGGAAGGNGPTGAAGGLNQTDGPSGGVVHIVIAAAPGTQAATNGGLQPAAAISSPNLTIPTQPVYQG